MLRASRLSQETVDDGTEPIEVQHALPGIRDTSVAAFRHMSIAVKAES